MGGNEHIFDVAIFSFSNNTEEEQFAEYNK